MKSFQPLKKSWKKTFTDIKKAKYIFIILFFTQLIFLIIISMIFFKYATEIGEAGRLAAEPIQGGALETPEALLANADTILQNYKAMIKNIVFLFIGILLSYLFINSINWDLTYVLANKKFSYLRYLRKFILFTIIFTLPALIVMAVIFNVFQEPKLAGISYEILRIGAKHQENLIMKLFLYPGFMLQRITTSEPTLKQIEVAAVALRAVVK